MSYQSMNDTYRGPERGRYEMAVSEQAHLTFAADPDPANKALADAVIGGSLVAIDALMRAVAVGPNGAVLGDDANLLSAVQAAWPVTAGAMYPAGG